MSLTSGSKAGEADDDLKGFMDCKLRALCANEIDQCQIRKGLNEALGTENGLFSADDCFYPCVYPLLRGDS